MYNWGSIYAWGITMNIDDMQTGTHIEVESPPVPTLSIHRCAYECRLRLTKTEVKQTKYSAYWIHS